MAYRAVTTQEGFNLLTILGMISTDATAPRLLFNLEPVVLPPAPAALEFHHRVALARKQYRRCCRQMADVRVAIEGVDLVFVETRLHDLSVVPLVLRQIECARDMPLCIIFGRTHIHDVHRLSLFEPAL